VNCIQNTDKGICISRNQMFSATNTNACFPNITVIFFLGNLEPESTGTNFWSILSIVLSCIQLSCIKAYSCFQPGGCKDGCFDKWPIHSEGERLSKAEMKRDKLHKTGKVFFPPAHYRTMYTCSIVNRKIDSAMNANNRRNFQPITFPNP